MTRVLHVLDHSLPLHSGYTFRTRAILKAQAAQGLEVRGITGYRHAADGPPVETVDGLTFHRTAGAASGPAGMREWREVSAHAQAIVRLAREWRPDILHAHSPALSGMAGAQGRTRTGRAARLRNPRLLGRCRGRQRHRSRRIDQVPRHPRAGKSRDLGRRCGDDDLPRFARRPDRPRLSREPHRGHAQRRRPEPVRQARAARRRTGARAQAA